MHSNCFLFPLVPYAAQIPPWDNRWLVGAIGTSMGLHCAILYIPPLARIFGVTALSGAEWWAVLWLSAPVILVDEVRDKSMLEERVEALEVGGAAGCRCHGAEWWSGLW